MCSSLSRDDIPIKLRCAVCSRLAVNAFRLPCCDQAICETCELLHPDLYESVLISVGQSTVKPTCPVCEHNPVSAGDCKPHKSLRTTIRVFLRTAEKKREALRVKDAPKETPPATPSTPTIPPAVNATEPNNASAAGVTGESKDEVAPPLEEPAAENVGSIENVAEAPAENQTQEPISNEDQQDIPHQSIEVGNTFPQLCLFAKPKKRKLLLAKNDPPMRSMPMSPKRIAKKKTIKMLWWQGK